MRLRRSSTCLLLGVLLLSAGCTGGDSIDESSASNGGGTSGTEPFYQEGDDLQWMVPFSPGGGTDTLARMFAPYLGEALGGVNIQVINRPGGGSVLGTNEYVNDWDPDGYTLFMSSGSVHMPAILGQEGVNYSFDDFAPLASLPTGGVIYAHSDSPFQEPIDLTPEGQERTALYAGQPASGAELRILLAFELMQTDLNPVLAYEGRGEARLAYEQEESDLQYDMATQFQNIVEPWIADGQAVPLMTFGWLEDGEVVRDPLFSEWPSVPEAYEDVFGEAPSGDAWEAYKAVLYATAGVSNMITIHRDAPPEAIAQLEGALESLTQDEEFSELYRESQGEYEIELGSRAAATWQAVSEIGPDSPGIPWLLEWLEETYDVRF